VKKSKQVYLSWDSFNGGFGVTAKAIELLKKKEKIIIDEVWYLHNRPLSNQCLKEKEAFLRQKKLSILLKDVDNKSDEEKRIKTCLRVGELLDKKPIFYNKMLAIKNVTDYQSIYNKLIEFLEQKFKDKTDVEININVSPGTPQMHVVWLMLNSAGFLPLNTKLWSTQFVKDKKKTTLSRIAFKPQTYLSQVLKSSYNRKQTIVINPNETLSNKRKEAERKIALFSAIPDAPLLLLGERGIGKSTYVRNLIIEQNPELPSAEVACGIFLPTLMRSELFGHKKGSFSDASSDKKGILDQFKNGGILFLDEIHDLQKPLQRQLMQVLQTGQFYPVGATEPSFAKFKLVTASNLPVEVLKGEILHRDFFNRIARFIVEIPPLRESREDLQAHWQNAWKEMASFAQAPSIFWNKELKTYLLKQQLYGNFRDLQKIVSYLIAFLIAGNTKSKSLNLAIDEFEKWKDKKNDSSQNSYFIEGQTYKEISHRFNKDLANWACLEYGGINNASKILGRGASTLYEDKRGK